MSASLYDPLLRISQPCCDRRRIVRRAVMALAVVVPLVAEYVSAWLCWARYRIDVYWEVPSNVVTTIDHCFDPIHWYTRNDYPGSDTLSRLWWKFNTHLHWSSPGRIDDEDV